MLNYLNMVSSSTLKWSKWSINVKKKSVSHTKKQLQLLIFYFYSCLLTDSTTLTITYMAVSMVINILTTCPSHSSLTVTIDPQRFPGDSSYAAGKLKPPTDRSEQSGTGRLGRGSLSVCTHTFQRRACPPDVHLILTA